MRLQTCVLAAIGACSLLMAQPQTGARKRDLKIEEVEPDAASPKRVLPVRSWAVIIGVARYPKLAQDQQLEFPESDAQSIFSVLISKEAGDFKAENVHMLTGPKATLAAMRHEIGEWLPQNAQEEDRVVIYFAGHGFLDKSTGQGYLAPYDVDPKNVTGTAYPMDELSRVVGSKIRAKNIILMTDACHSGAISPDDAEGVNKKLLSLSRSLFSLTASRDREVSYESPQLKAGLFTYYVKTGLEGEADTNLDGLVTADELAEYVRTQVRETAMKLNYRQNPTSDRGSFDADLWLSSVPFHKRPANAPAPKLGTLVFEANRDGVEVFLDGNSIGVLDRDHKNIAKPGLQPGEHTVQGVLMGWEPDGPRQVIVNPGETNMVSLKLLFQRRRKKAAADALENGIEEYQNKHDYKKAVDFFQKALAIDDKLSPAACYLGLSYNALFDNENAKKYFQKALVIDPDYIDAHAAYGAILLDTGDTDEAIRQFNAVLTHDPNHVEALKNQAQAYRLKGMYAESIESAQKAIQLAPKNADPHLWLGDSLRLTKKYDESLSEYVQYLNLSHFDSGLAGKLNYHVLGFLIGFGGKLGTKTHAGTHDIWVDMRSLAFFGLCDSEYRMRMWDQAIVHCQRALTYDAKDPFAHFVLGLSYMAKANETGDRGNLIPAEKHLKQVIDINPNLEEATYAKKNLEQIRQAYATK